ncbi:MAG TPA: hypothetical protein VJH68_05710 [Candidatus Nanoarchaeia archaeon]|nr:hypothetical protein [Candidatus Nanoarchaeia archaeon]
MGASIKLTLPRVSIACIALSATIATCDYLSSYVSASASRILKKREAIEQMYDLRCHNGLDSSKRIGYFNQCYR